MGLAVDQHLAHFAAIQAQRHAGGVAQIAVHATRATVTHPGGNHLLILINQSHNSPGKTEFFSDGGQNSFLDLIDVRRTLQGEGQIMDDLKIAVGAGQLFTG